MKIVELKTITIVIMLLIGTWSFANKPINSKTIDQRIDSLLSLMTLDEKIGQMNQYSSSWATGPLSIEGDKIEAIKTGKVGSLLNVKGVANTTVMQKLALQSRLKIPLLFGLDVIHGYKTTFPIPLAEVASWDLQAIETGARIAAIETAASGVHWTFAPMVDIARDPRWGRVMEGAGEDTYLGCLVAKARVKGFQGEQLGKTDAVMACAKHFAAYGAAIGGRDYNSVDMSLRTLWDIYLPPFKAAVDAGAATFMNSFNDINGIPATGNSYLQRDILKGKWNFQGFVVSDWGSIGEMVTHGYLKDDKEAAYTASKAGNDVDMESRCYIDYLSTLIKQGRVSESIVDESVRRILRKKFELGLFDNPFRFSDEKREKAALSNPMHRAIARDIAKKSIVLLKNTNDLLPLRTTQKIAVIGPLAKSEKDMLGYWNIDWGNYSEVVSPLEGIEARVGKGNLLYAKGCEVNDSTQSGFAEAIATAKQADVVVLSIGEKRDMSGEAKSRSNIHLPGVQEELVKAIIATGKPVVVMINAGRPLIFNWTADHAQAILYTWWLGSEAGNAMADVLFGDYNPSGRLPITFPQSEGQIPIYYNYFNTGRPTNDDEHVKRYGSGYIDLVKQPRYPFGFGLSYTQFVYSDLNLSKKTMKEDDNIEVSLVVTNTGKRKGEEVVQLYLRDKVASLIRPVKELKGFQKINLMPGENKAVRFIIDKEKLSFYNNNLEWVAEPGAFEVMIGASAQDIRLRNQFELE
ncbi:MAG: beta-glucosidase BglX [Bacteroidales bacterium]